MSLHESASPTIRALPDDHLRHVRATLERRTAAVGADTGATLAAMAAEDDGDCRRALLAHLYDLSREAGLYRQHLTAIEAERLAVGLLAGDGDAEAARSALVGMEFSA